MLYYFAYGSNMSLSQMSERCPGAMFISSGVLNDYRFQYDGYSNSRKGAVANIIHKKGEIVRGVIFKVTEEHQKTLDSYEGHPKVYDRKNNIKVKDKYGNEYLVFAYLRIRQKVGEPSEDYRGIVIRSALDCDFPKDYIETYL